MEQTVNITLKLHNFQITNFEEWLRHEYDVISFKIIPNTEKLYETNPTFKKLVKEVKKAQEVRDKFINDYNE